MKGGLSVKIVDGGATSNLVRVTPQHQLVTGPLEFSGTTQQDLDTIDTAFNFVIPQVGTFFTLTGFIVNTTKSIDINGATIEIYETSAVDSTTVDKQIYKFDLTRQQIVVLSSKNIMITEGKFLNAKTDSATVLVTIDGYFAELNGTSEL